MNAPAMRFNWGQNNMDYIILAVCIRNTDSSYPFVRGVLECNMRYDCSRGIKVVCAGDYTNIFDSYKKYCEENTDVENPICDDNGWFNTSKFVELLKGNDPLLRLVNNSKLREIVEQVDKLIAS